MDSFDHTLPADLAEMLESYQLQRHAEDNMARPWYTGNASTIIDKYSNSRNKAIQLALFQMQTIILSRAGGSRYADYIPQYLRSITKLKLVNSLASDKANRGFLAYACVETVRCRVEKKEISSRYGIGDLLSQWLGRKLKPREYSDLNAVISLLYGPAVTSLYRHDVADDKLAVYLWELDLKVAEPKNVVNGLVQQTTADLKPDSENSMLPGYMV